MNNNRTPFKDGDPGDTWLQGFQKETSLSIKKLQPIELQDGKHLILL